MRLHSPHANAAQRAERTLAQAGGERALAEELLGAGHPLVTLVSRLDTVLEQVVAVSAVQAAGGVFAFGDHGFGTRIAIAAVVVQVALGCRLALLRMNRRELCVALLVEQGSGMGLPIVERERCRLLDPRTIRQLAESIEKIVGTAARQIPRPTAGPPIDVRVIRAVSPQLREIATLLRGDVPPLRGVAAVERLLAGAAAPLYGHDVEPLRQELLRARYLLIVKQ